LQAADQAVKIFDINLRLPHPPYELIDESLRHANVLKCNEEELLLLCDWLQIDVADRSSDQNTAVATATKLQQRFDLQCVFWTRGASGCMLQRGEQVSSGDVPQMPQFPQADTVGAGDAASAALAVGLVAGWSDDRIVAVANYCGAFAASQRGATTPFPEDFLDQLVVK
ncbi:MAG: PfkB family carbohydrate kinase, partial [Aureliella sp.]